MFVVPENRCSVFLCDVSLSIPFNFVLKYLKTFFCERFGVLNENRENIYNMIYSVIDDNDHTAGTLCLQNVYFIRQYHDNSRCSGGAW